MPPGLYILREYLFLSFTKVQNDKHSEYDHTCLSLLKFIKMTSVQTALSTFHADTDPLTFNINYLHLGKMDVTIQILKRSSPDLPLFIYTVGNEIIMVDENLPTGLDVS